MSDTPRTDMLVSHYREDAIQDIINLSRRLERALARFEQAELPEEKRIDIGFSALTGGRGGEPWDKDLCRCDPGSLEEPPFHCEYCAIHDALTAGKEAIAHAARIQVERDEAKERAEKAERHYLHELETSQLEHDRAEAAERCAEKALAWTDEDKPLPEDAEIHAHHPVVNESYKTYEEALRLVGAKRSKGALVDLVNWLLQSADENANKLSALIVVAEKACVNYIKKMPDNDPHKGPLNYLIDAIDAIDADRSEEGKK